jgi:hypothetical protein
MIPLRELNIPTILDTSTHDLTRDFFAPLLSNAVCYDRGAGFFSSGWLRINAQAMVAFAQNGGRARWVTSPILSEADWEALQAGNAARDDIVLRRVLARSIGDLVEALERQTLSALAWIVADEIITFKLALPRNKLDRGEFHDKFGVFTGVEAERFEWLWNNLDPNVRVFDLPETIVRERFSVHSAS